MSNKMTQREVRHTNRLIRILDAAIKKVEPLTDGLFPNTTQKALVGLLNLRSHTQIRIVSRDAGAI